MDLSQKKLFWKRNLKANDELQLKFLKRLYRLLESGYPILIALEKLKWDHQFSKFSSTIMTSLKSGDTIDHALEQLNFHPSITSFLYFVKANNDLEGSLKKAIDMFEQHIINGNKFKQIIRYPILLLIIFSILLYFVKVFVLPSFLDIFTEESNRTVYYTISFIDILTTFITVCGITFCLLGIIWVFIERKVSIQNKLRLYKNIPIYKNYVTMQTSYFFATHFSSLLKTGMSYKEILEHMANQQKLPIISYYAKIISLDLAQGVQFSYLVSQLEFFDQQLISMFQQDTDVRTLELDLSIYAELLMEDMNAKTIKILTGLQPVLLILIGGFIIFLYISLMWPMFQLIKTI